MYTNKEYITMYSIRIIKYMCVYGIRIKRVKNGKGKWRGACIFVYNISPLTRNNNILMII